MGLGNFNPGCACCGTGTPGPCECRDGTSGPIIARPTLQAVIAGTIASTGGFSVQCDPAPTCPDPTGTYTVACGDQLSVLIVGETCEHPGGVFPAGTPARNAIVVNHGSSGVDATYTALGSNRVTVTVYNQYYILLGGTMQWRSWCRGNAISAIYSFTTPSGDECPTFSSSGISASTNECFAPSCSCTCDLSGLTISLSVL